MKGSRASAGDPARSKKPGTGGGGASTGSSAAPVMPPAAVANLTAAVLRSEAANRMVEAARAAPPPEPMPRVSQLAPGPLVGQIQAGVPAGAREAQLRRLAMLQMLGGAR